MDKADMDENYTYIVRCADGTLYTGWTNDLKKRIKAHNAGKGAKYTKTRRPVELVYFEHFAAKLYYNNSCENVTANITENNQRCLQRQF